MLDVLESSSVLMLEVNPPMRSVPTGDCQDTCAYRAIDREWDSSHSPLKVLQVVLVG